METKKELSKFQFCLLKIGLAITMFATMIIMISSGKFGFKWSWWVKLIFRIIFLAIVYYILTVLLAVPPK